MSRLSLTWPAGAVLAALVLGACAADTPTNSPTDAPGFYEPSTALNLIPVGADALFTPLPASAACVAGGTSTQLELPVGLVGTLVATEGGGYLDQPDMQTVNETGPEVGRFLYRTHELGSNAGVSVTDLATGATTLLARRADWERFDGIVWTPWGTILAAEETNPSALKDPAAPNALGGQVYEIDPTTGTATLRDAIGAKAHEGMRFDRDGNLYGISESGPGYVYRFVPTHRGDLSQGTLYALKIVDDQGDRTGWAQWVALDPESIRIDALAEGTRQGATGYARPEDIEIGTSTGSDRRGDRILYVAVTGEDRVLAIDLAPSHPPVRGQVFVSDYVRDGVNAPADFDFPDNLALDNSGNLYITEDPGGSAAGGKIMGDDVWFAPFNPASATIALPIQRFLSITDCDAEPTGIYLSPSNKSLFIDVQHRGGTDPRDQTWAVQRITPKQFLRTQP